MTLSPAAVERPPLTAPSPFDGAAGGYDATFSNDPLAGHLRGEVWRRIEGSLERPSLLLDIGAGTGVDTLHFAELGHRVVAVDRSEEMLRVLRDRLAAAGRSEETPCRALDANQAGEWDRLVDDLRLEGRVDLVYSDFGAVNCILELGALAHALKRLVRPGGRVVLVSMPRVCPLELLALPIRGATFAFRRLRSYPEARVDEVRFPIAYHGPTTLARALAPAFRLIRSQPLGLLLPAPPRKRPLPDSLCRGALALERALAHVPVIRAWGDHVIVELERAP